MNADLELMATQFCWVCSNCHQKYDAFWRPQAQKCTAPPKAYQWMADKPTFKYCPECGAHFGEESCERKETCEL